MKKFYKLLLTWLVIVTTTGLILLGLLWVRENYFSKKNQASGLKSTYSPTPLPKSHPVYPEKMTAKDYHLLRPSHNYRHTFSRGDGSLIYEVNYEMDGAGYRNPENKKYEDRSHHILMVGCSLVFGLGLPQEETLSFYLQENFPKASVYNLGLPGSGPNDHYALFSKYSLNKYITQPEGAMVYVYFVDHYDRATTTPQYMDWAETTRPIFKLNSEGELYYSGILEQQDEYKSFKKIKELGLSQSSQELSHIAPIENANSTKLVAKLIKGIENKYLENFPNGKFYFAVIPHTYAYDEETKKVVEEVKKLNIKVLPYEEMHRAFTLDSPPEEVSPYVISREEGHPNGVANKTFADVLSKFLKPL